MTYKVITIRTAEYEDGSLYPVLGDERNEIDFERLDGRNLKTVYASAVHVRRSAGSTLVKEVSVPDVKVSVYITDARVAIACSKYDKGGGWIGGSVAVPVLNLASKARAASRRRGKMLVGHVRYPWLASVGFTEKTGFGSTDSLRLGVVDTAGGANRSLFLDLDFPKGTDTARLAHLISQRCATYRLRHDADLTPDQRTKFEALASGPTQHAVPKKFVFFKMPTHFFVSAGSAYPKAVDGAARTAVPGDEPAAPEAPAVEPATAPLLAATATVQFPEPVIPSAPVALAAPKAPTATENPARWADDPYGLHQLRYWNGILWTEHVSDHGTVTINHPQP